MISGEFQKVLMAWLGWGTWGLQRPRSGACPIQTDLAIIR
jgi:hypothetical protein